MLARQARDTACLLAFATFLMYVSAVVGHFTVDARKQILIAIAMSFIKQQYMGDICCYIIVLHFPT